MPRVPLWTSLRHTLRSRPFCIVILANVAGMVGVNLSLGMGNYVAIYYVYGGDKQAAAPLLGWAGVAFVAVAMFAAPLMSSISRRFGKRETQQGALLLACVGTLASWWLYSPEHPWLQLLLPLFVTPAMLGVWMFGESMVGDISALETEETGERLEAVFCAVFGWILKASAAVAVLGSNLLLNATGFEVSLGMNQPDGTVLRMRLLFIGFLFAGFLASFLVFFLYQLKPSAPTTERTGD
jgi:GPH family glycoside/pentoside/hexuronide:cation symporter